MGYWLILVLRSTARLSMLLFYVGLFGCNTGVNQPVDLPTKQSTSVYLTDISVDFAVHDMLVDENHLWILGWKPQIVALNLDTLAVDRDFSGAHLIANAFTKVGDILWLLNDDVDVPRNGFIRKVDAKEGFVLDVLEVGRNPKDILFDGEYVWVSNYSDGSVMKIDAVTSRIVGTFAVDKGPRALGFDGVKIWVTSYEEGTILALDRQTGKTLQRYQVSPMPYSLTFSINTIWLLHTGGLITSFNVDPSMASVDSTSVGANLCPLNEDKLCLLSAFEIVQQRLWITRHPQAALVSLDVGSGTIVEEISLPYPRPEKVVHVSRDSHSYLFVSFYGLSRDSVSPPITRIELMEK
jgi:hypothetical protein